MLIIETDDAALEPYFWLLSDELNILTIKRGKLEQLGVYARIEGSSEIPTLYIDPTITETLRLQGMAREIERFVQNLRKASGLQVGDSVVLYYETDNRNIYDAFEYFNQAKTGVSQIIGERMAVDFESTISIAGSTLWLGIKREK